MKRQNMKLAVISFGLAIMTGFPIGSAWNTTSAWAHSVAKSSKSQTFKGPTVDSRYGPVRVSIVVKSKKITSVGVVNSPDSTRGQLIQGQAVPILKQETLTAQSSNVNLVSGATQTSDAFIQSLQSAIKKARSVKALK
jgi:uncharacterized protein with FMN-binding domain